MKKLKLLGLAMVALAAISAISASGASAANYKCITSGTCYITAEGEAGESNQTFTAGAKVVCTNVKGEGEFVNEATSITATNIAYTGCTVAGQAATVTFNGCDYKFGEPTGSVSPFTIKTITITCPAEKEIVIKATTSGCTIKVKGQTTTGTTTATNAEEAGVGVVLLGANISNIASTSSGGVCGTAGESKTATYTGKVRVTGFKERVQKEGVTIEHKTRTSIKIS